MCISNEIRVGFMFLTGLILLVLLIVSVTRWGQDRNTYAFTIRFKQAQGLLVGAPVRVGGVEVGRVSVISLDPANNEALVTVRVNRGVQVFRRYNFTIGIGGLVGERYVDILPNPGEPGARVTAGDDVTGTLNADMNDLVANASNLVNKLTDTTNSLNTMLGDPENQQNLKATIANMQRASASAAELTAALNATMARNQQSLDLLVANLYDVSGDIRRVSDVLGPQLEQTDMLRNLETASANAVLITQRLDRIAGAVDTMVNDKELSASIKDTLAHLRQTSVDMEVLIANARVATEPLPRITANIERASADLPEITRPFKELAPDLVDDLRHLSERLRTASDDIGQVAHQVSTTTASIGALRVEPEVRVSALSGGLRSSRSDVNVDFRGKTNMLRLGVANLGNDSSLNAQIGNRLGERGWFRYGVVQSQLGAGIDYQFTPDLRASGELFDPEKIRANVTVDYRLRQLGEDWWLTSGWYDIFDRRNAFGLGMAYRP